MTKLLDDKGKVIGDQRLAFPFTLDLRWGANSEEAARVVLHADGTVTADKGRVEEWLRNARMDAEPTALLLVWMLRATIAAAAQAPATEPASASATPGVKKKRGH